MDLKLFEIKRREYIAALKKGQDCQSDRNALYRTVFHGVGLIVMSDKPTGDEVKQQWNVACSLLSFISHLTPTELTMIFPISKRYDGEKYEMKDYFYTIEMINKHGWNKPIDDPFDFLWDYENLSLRKFMLRLMILMDSFSRVKGRNTLGEEFAEELGLEIYKLQKTCNGKEFMMDKRGRTFSVEKKRPKHLRVVR